MAPSKAAARLIMSSRQSLWIVQRLATVVVCPIGIDLYARDANRKPGWKRQIIVIVNASACLLAYFSAGCQTKTFHYMIGARNTWKHTTLCKATLRHRGMLIAFETYIYIMTGSMSVSGPKTGEVSRMTGRSEDIHGRR